MAAARSVHVKQEVLVRIFADILLLNLSVITALVVRFFYLVIFGHPLVDFTYNTVFWNYVIQYRNSGWLLTAICLVVFAMSGFYTYGRAYKGPYKALIVTQAVS